MAKKVEIIVWQRQVDIIFSLVKKVEIIVKNIENGGATVYAKSIENLGNLTYK